MAEQRHQAVILFVERLLGCWTKSGARCAREGGEGRQLGAASGTHFVSARCRTSREVAANSSGMSKKDPW